MTKVVLPELGEGITKASVSYWHIELGQPIKEGEDLVEMVTEKAVFNVPAPCSGILTERLFPEGAEVKVNETLAIIDEGKT